MEEARCKAATLTFDVSDGAGERELLCALYGQTVILSVWEMLANKRREWVRKGGVAGMTPEAAVQVALDWLREDLEDHGVDVERLVQS